METKDQPVRKVAPKQTRKKGITPEIKEDYIYIPINKKKLSFLVIPLIFFLALLLLNVFIKPEVKQSLVNKSAMWLYEKSVTRKFVQAKWLPKDYILSQVLPKDGYQTKLSLGSIGPQMVRAGVIDMQKLEELYKNRGGIPQDMKEMLRGASNTPIRVTQENSAWLLNILWPMGVANKMAINEKSPIAGENVGRFASTGGWTLGLEQNGGAYFNTLKLITLTPAQEKRVLKLGESIYRPCCDNSSFFQDCNHGSAALALIELGVAQGLSDKEIYKAVLVFNSYWFPRNYTETALYFQAAKNQIWNDVNPKIILAKEYSSISGWSTNIDTPAQQIPGLFPPAQSGGGCSV